MNHAGTTGGLSMKAHRPPRRATIWLARTLAIVALAGAWQSTSADAAPAAIVVAHAWARATPPGLAVGAAYFDIINSGAADTLLALESPVAGRVEVHSSKIEGGMMTMRPEPALAIPAGGRVAFSPGHLHTMLLDLHQPLVQGTVFELTLIFRHAGRVSVPVTVRKLDAAASD